MTTQTSSFKVRLGLFIIGGLGLFVLAIFIIGKEKNYFNPVFKLTTSFHNVSGLEVGSNVRFTGINVGTVDNISINDDSTVKVDMLIKKSMQKYIKSDCEAGIGSSGIIGDRLLTITQGDAEAPVVTADQKIASKEPIETDAIVAGLKKTVDNASVVAEQMQQIAIKINRGKGTLSKLINDPTMAKNFNQTVINLKQGTKSLDENMDAAKDSFLLRGAYKRREKEEEKTKKEALKKAAQEKKAKAGGPSQD